MKYLIPTTCSGGLLFLLASIPSSKSNTTLLLMSWLMTVLVSATSTTGAFVFSPNNKNKNNKHYIVRSSGNLSSPDSTKESSTTARFISSGFSFSDGDQILVSVQKPLGIILEQSNDSPMIYVAQVDPSGSAGRAGVLPGDILLAVQNASLEENVPLEAVLDFIGNAPQVVNLRFLRMETDSNE